MQKTRTWWLACGIVLALGGQAWAQTVPVKERGFVNVNAAFQATSQTVDQGGAFPLYDEDGSFEASRKIGGGVVVDVSGGMRLWRRLGIGVGYTMFSDKSAADVAGQVPNPLFVGRPRPVTLQSGDLKHSEQAVHIQGVWFLEIMPGFDVALSFGPSIFSVKTDAIKGIGVTETGYPYSQVTAQISGTESLKKSAVGFNVGADVTYMFTPYIGVGGMIRYARASVTLDPSAGDSFKVNAGGPQVGAGVRFRF